MSEQEERDFELSPFEADLAALTPRVDGFDRERVIFEAGRAAAMLDRDVTPSGKRRWAWPAAFSAMTAVAAALVAMLCMRAEPKVAINDRPAVKVPELVTHRIHETPPGPVGMPVDRDMPDVAETPNSAPPAWLSLWLAISPPPDSAADFADATFTTMPFDTDPALRAELRRHGIVYRPPDKPSAASSTGLAEGPLSYHELLGQLQGKPATTFRMHREFPFE